MINETLTLQTQVTIVKTGGEEVAIGSFNATLSTASLTVNCYTSFMTPSLVAEYNDQVTLKYSEFISSVKAKALSMGILYLG